MIICEEEMEIMVIDSNERSQSDELDCSTLIRDIPGSNSIETRFSFLSYLSVVQIVEIFLKFACTGR